jgi:hypothetical protein
MGKAKGKGSACLDYKNERLMKARWAARRKTIGKK